MDQRYGRSGEAVPHSPHFLLSVGPVGSAQLVPQEARSAQLQEVLPEPG